MKFELERIEQNEYPSYPPYLLTIRRTEFLKCYEENQEEMFEDLSYIIEMFCSPNCFNRTLSELAIHNRVKNFAPKYRAFFLQIIENDEGEADLRVGYLHK